MPQKRRYARRKIIGQIATLDALTKQTDTGFAASWRHVRKQDAMRRIFALQRRDQGCGRARFTHRHGMHPDHRRIDRKIVTTEALPNMLTVCRLAARAPVQMQQRLRQQQPQQNTVGQARHYGQTFSSAINTSATEGTLPFAPTLQARTPP